MSSNLRTDVLDESVAIPDDVRESAARFLARRGAVDIAEMLGLGAEG